MRLLISYIFTLIITITPLDDCLYKMVDVCHFIDAFFGHFLLACFPADHFHSAEGEGGDKSRVVREKGYLFMFHNRALLSIYKHFLSPYLTDPKSYKDNTKILEEFSTSSVQITLDHQQRFKNDYT